MNEKLQILFPATMYNRKLWLNVHQKYARIKWRRVCSNIWEGLKRFFQRIKDAVRGFLNARRKRIETFALWMRMLNQRKRNKRVNHRRHISVWERKEMYETHRPQLYRRRSVATE